MTVPGTAMLRRALHGDLFAPVDAAFADACRGFNLAAVHAPDLVVRAAGASDVATAIRWSAGAGQPVSVHATGHGSGAPADGGVLVSTARLRRLVVDPARATARVGAGVRWQEVIDAAAPHGLAPLSGSAPGVGVIGYTLGGGMGPMARTFGFAADHVRRIEMVSAAGDLVTATEHQEPDLFWALRGGKCEVGVVTSVEFDLMPVTGYYGGAIYFAGTDAPAVLGLFTQWAPTLPDSVTASIALLRLPDAPAVPAPLRGTLSVHLRFVHIGDAACGASLLAPMRAVAAPLLDTIAPTPYARIGSVHSDPTEPMPARDDALLLDALPPAAVGALLAAAGPDTDVPLVIVELRHLGGALAREPRVPNAVGGRGGAFCLTVIGAYPPPLRDAVDGAIDAVLDAVRPWSSGSRPINFQGSATAPQQVRRAWSEAAVQRLVRIKDAWDPERRFRFGYSILD